jgi:hypothetical protein
MKFVHKENLEVIQSKNAGLAMRAASRCYNVVWKDAEKKLFNWWSTYLTMYC